jgi:chitinase
MIMVGQPLYGRSFQMSEAGCYTEECTFTGPDSGALLGPCTGTPSYIGNWEIDQIISNSQYESTVEEYYSEVAGDILVYDSTQWISWMKPSTYNSRSEWVQGINFGGTCDWAMDVNASYAPNGTPIGEGSGVVYISPDIYSSASPTVTCLPPCAFVFPP